MSAATQTKAAHYLTVMVVFGITGSLAVVLSRLILNDALGMDGSFWAGPWSYRLAYVALIPPSYSAMLIVVGTLFGKHDYFKRRVTRLWGWPVRWLGRVR